MVRSLHHPGKLLVRLLLVLLFLLPHQGLDHGLIFCAQPSGGFLLRLLCWLVEVRISRGLLTPSLVPVLVPSSIISVSVAISVSVTVSVSIPVSISVSLFIPAPLLVPVSI